VDPRQLSVQLVLELLLTVSAVQVFEISSRVITRAKIELQVRVVDLHFQSAEFSVFQRIVAREAENVVRRTVFLNLREDPDKIIRIEKRLASRVRREFRVWFLPTGLPAEPHQLG